MPSAKQQEGYDSNAIARQFLLNDGYTFVWFKPHPRWPDTVFIDKSGAKMAAKDIWGLFDGIAFKRIGYHSKRNVKVPVFLQIKTNSWRGWKDIVAFAQDKAINVMFINVVDGEVRVRTI